ncbi:C-terminal binding protein AN-like isoform X2 [Durio zibethinus]|uniref:C-terminal binding protein AN-like isoform X2 n=1 Tax=Durio zibethinus TaxID=66656 RepID=A0A6P6B0D3_DURZI|nr:C-terminal binding protein AN-like isoform X2 [Durio zibethinus]
MNTSTTTASSRLKSSDTMPHRNNPTLLPLVVSLNCIEDCVLEQESLAGVALVEHVPLSGLGDGKIEAAAAVLLHSLAYLPRAAQRRIRPYQLILCLGSSDRAVDSALAADLGLNLVHVDASRAEEIADTVMALFLGLLRRTHLLSRHTLSASGWLGSVQPLCRGMRRCPGLVLGIVGRSASAQSLASRSLAFKMSVLYFDVVEVKEMPNVLILPRSADYSEEVWMEIREKAISMLQTFFFDGVIPKDAISDEDEQESEIVDEKGQFSMQDKEGALQGSCGEQSIDDIKLSPESSLKKDTNQSKESPNQSQGSSLSHNTAIKSDGKRSRSGKKAKKRHARQRNLQKSDEPLILEKESTSQIEDDTAMSGTDQALSSGSQSPEDSRSRKTPIELMQVSTTVQLLKTGKKLSGQSVDMLKDGYVIALYSRDRPALHVSRQRVKGGGWFLDTMSNVTKRDPAAQFLVVYRSKDTIGLRSFAAGGKLLQINRRMEFVFASHSFDVWESWTLQGPLEECRLVNCRNPSAVLDVRIEILAAVGEDDGVTRWLD